MAVQLHPESVESFNNLIMFYKKTQACQTKRTSPDKLFPLLKQMETESIKLYFGWEWLSQIFICSFAAISCLFLD